MATYKLEIDGSGAESGAQRIVKSFNDIKAAAEKMEGGVSAAAQKASAAFGRMQSAAKPISQGAIDSLKQLSAVFKGFRGPSDAAVRNTIMFLQGLQAVGRLNIGGTASLASLLKAIAGFKGPTPMAGKNTESLLKALRAAASISAGRGLVSVLNSLATFKGPSAYAAKNITAMLNSLAAFKAPRGLQAATNALNALTAAANTANGAVQRLNVSTARKMNVNINTATAHKNISSLIRQHSLWQMAILRTQTLWNALGGVLAARAIVNASNDIIKIRAQLEAATGSAQQARVQFGFLQEKSLELGLNFRETARSYGFFLGAVKGTGISFKEAQTIFSGFSTAARALQLSTSDVDGVFRALGQIMSKGKLQAEELRQQLGDRLPGAFVRFAKALDMTKPGELDAALKKGAISGDKLKKAILEVAATLEIEFADSAEKMSKTVDAAFNRLMNSFTMAAEGLGRSGMNEALIGLADALRAFLESSALSDALSVLGRMLKFVAENINLVVYAMGTLALAATLKWLAGLQGLVTVIAALRAIALEVAVAIQLVSAGLAATTAAATLATRAFTILWAVIRAHPFIFIASAIVALISIMNKFSSSADENLSRVEKLTGTIADAENVYDAYINKTYEAGNALDDETKSIKANTIAALENARVKLQTAGYGPTSQLRGGGIQVGGYKLGPVHVGGEVLGPGAARFVERIQKQNLTQLATTPAQLRAQVVAGATLKQFEGTREGEALAEYRRGITDAINLAVSYSRTPEGKARMGFDASEILKQKFGDYNKEAAAGATITGEAVGGAGKGGKSDAEKWADKLERAIRSAQEAMSDLALETQGAMTASDNLLAGMNPLAVAAQQAAEQQLKSFKDTFASADEEAKGIMALAEDMMKNGQLARDADISSAAAAEQAILGVMSARQKENAEAKKNLEVSQEIANMHQENELQKKANALLAAGGTQADYNKLLFVEQQLLGTSAKYREENIDRLEEEYDAKVKLARQTELLNAQRELEIQKTVNTQMAGVYATGGTPEEVANLKEIIELRAKMATDGATEQEILDRVRVVEGMQEQIRIMKKMEEEYEKLVQLATDMADAIVQGFKDGIENGKGFLGTIKGIFKELKNIILDFVLYNPLRDFLKNAILGGLGGGGAGPAGGTTTSTAGGIVGTAGGGGIGGFFNNLLGLGGSQTGTSTPSAGTKAVANEFGESVAGAMAALDAAEGGTSTYDAVTQLTQTTKKQESSFSKLGKFFDPARNQKMFTDMKAAFSSGNLAKGIGGAIGIAGEAYAAWSMGKKLGAGAAKLVGGGFRTQAVMGGIVGGGMAGYKLGSMFGPMGGAIGAAVGAVVGGVLGFLKKKPKIPSSYGSVVVGDDGIAVVGEAGKYGKGVKKVGQQMASAAAKMFNDFAMNLDATLTAGSYGTFGRRKFSTKKSAAEEAFYSMIGVSKKGKPLGREGVDWIKGTESEVQAFALIQQVRKGMITGLSSVMQTVFANTAATTMEQLEEDINVGKAYEAFIKGSFKETDLAKQVREINEAWKKLSRQAIELGLSEEKLIEARNRMLNQMKEDFNYEIQQGILEFENPMLAAYNDLVKEYEATVENAMAVGGDLVAVEKYYGLKRTELMKQMAEEANNGIKKIAKDLLTSLTASSSSPLSAQAVFGTAQSMFRGLAAQIASGDYSNVDQLNTYATNYLDAARAIGASSTTYFDIFQEVTDFLKSVSDATSEGGVIGGDMTEMPALPDIDTIVAEITARNAEIVTATEQVGTTIIEGTTQIVDTLNAGFGGLLGYFYGLTGQQVPAGTLPASGTGVSSTGGTSSGGGSSYYGGGGGGGSFGEFNTALV